MLRDDLRSGRGRARCRRFPREGSSGASRPMRADHDQPVHEYPVQRDYYAEPDEPPEAGGRWPGGASVRAVGENEVQPRSTFLPVHGVRARVHDHRQGHTTVSFVVRERSRRLRTADEQLRLRLAGQSRLFEAAGKRRPRVVRRPQRDHAAGTVATGVPAAVDARAGVSTVVDRRAETVRQRVHARRQGLRFRLPDAVQGPARARLLAEGRRQGGAELRRTVRRDVLHREGTTILEDLGWHLGLRLRSFLLLHLPDVPHRHG